VVDPLITISAADLTILRGVVLALAQPVTAERLRQLQAVTNGVFACQLQPPPCRAHEDCRSNTALGIACAGDQASHG